MKITICGSMAFYNEMVEIEKKLVDLGNEVKVPELELVAPEEFGGSNKVNFAKYVEDHGGMDFFPVEHKIWDVKGGAIKDHFRKIEWSDVILVVNPDKKGIAGYVGGNTLIEIGLAFYLNKKIFVLNQISSELSYRQEIYGMKPMFINGNLDIIK